MRVIKIPLDFRWHAFTLVAVFLALGIGIVIGVLVPQDRLLVERQKDMIARLEGDFERLRADNRRLSEENTRLRLELTEQWTTLEALATRIISGRLQGYTVLVLEVGDVSPSLRAQVADTLKEAGARIVDGSHISWSIMDATTWHPEALVIIGDEAANEMLSENLPTVMRRLVALGVPLVVTGTSSASSKTTGIWSELGVKRIPDLSRVENRVELVMSLMNDSAAPVPVEGTAP